MFRTELKLIKLLTVDFVKILFSRVVRSKSCFVSWRRWLRRMLDDTCFGETVSDFEDFKKTPEVAAHGALVCNFTQMLLDPDDEEFITVFPPIPPSGNGRALLLILISWPPRGMF